MYKNKYLKYKSKYVDLKYKQSGGANIFASVVRFFTDTKLNSNEYVGMTPPECVDCKFTQEERPDVILIDCPNNDRCLCYKLYGVCIQDIDTIPLMTPSKSFHIECIDGSCDHDEAELQFNHYDFKCNMKYYCDKLNQLNEAIDKMEEKAPTSPNTDIPVIPKHIGYEPVPILLTGYIKEILNHIDRHV